jgi:16S rRNA A1518/A1519 N6-dimethyltransferase RsmA/KsgA/DIM1 with predicted DNA glycosylase/AP lyase activity
VVLPVKKKFDTFDKVLANLSRGAYFTPPDVADTLASRATALGDTEYLDPAAGDGALVKALIRRGVAPSSITAIEIDPGLCAKMRADPELTGVTIIEGDALRDY